MASGKPGQPQNQARQNGGASGPLQGLRDQASEAAEKLRQQTGEAGERIKEGYDSARESVSHGYRRAEGLFARNPAPSVLIGFGLGFGLGVLLTAALTRREETWADRYLPDSLRGIPDRLRNAHLPESITRHIPSR